MKRIGIFSATPFEIAPLAEHLNARWSEPQPGFFEKNGIVSHPCFMGVGAVSASLFVSKYLALNELDLAVCAGIGGAIDPALALGEVVNIISETHSDLGAEEVDGSLLDVFELGLAEPDAWPFVGGILKNPTASEQVFLPTAHGISGSRAHGWAVSIEKMKAKWPWAQVESMEGAAFFQACLIENVPFLEIRAISNRVEPRDRKAWQLHLAIENLNRTLIEMLETMAAEAA